MYKVMHWMKSLFGDVIGNGKYIKVERYFTDSKKAIEYFFEMSEVHKNIALVLGTEHIEIVFMYHYDGDFPKELRPHTFTEIFTDIESVDGSVEEI